MALCVSCSREIPGDSRICPFCAVPVDSTAGAPTVTAPLPFAFGTDSEPASEPSAPDAIHHGRFTPGTILAHRYRIVGLLGEGGMGEVYRAEDVVLGQQVALKFLSKSFARNERLRRAFQQEVRVARHVSHPNVCRVYDVSEAAGEYFISMEYIDGEDLASLTRRIGRLPEDVALRIARQICGGLAAAHESGVLHRDMKPRNIMFDARGKASIADFGIAGFAHSFSASSPGIGAGTLAYMAPEQLARKEVTERSDIYSLGLVLYYLFTGQPAFKADSVEEMLRIRTQGTIVPPSSIVTDLDPRIDRLIMRCVSSEPAARPASAHAVARELPGGDQLAEMVAAGVTPSPDLVAGLGGAGSFTPAASVVVLVTGLFGICLVAFLADRTSLLSYVQLPKSPAVLADRAGGIIQQLTGAKGVGGRSEGFAVDYSVLSHIAGTDLSKDRWRALSVGQPPAVYYWYQRSPSPRPTCDPGANGDPCPAPLTGPGSVSVRLDPQGRLTAFEWIPREGKHSEAGDQTSWMGVFEAAGLSIADFEKAEPKIPTPVPCDARFAWRAQAEGKTSQAPRIEAGALQGRPVYFEIVHPWNQSTRSPVSGDSGYDILILSLTVLYLGTSMLLARRNLRLGIGDLKRAMRLASFFLISEMVRSLVDLERMPNFGSLWQAVVDLTGEAMFWAAFIWLMYMALEPYMRRCWPRTLISWNRLLSGRVRDPAVGSELLTGVALGTFLLALDQLGHLIPQALRTAPPIPYAASMSVLLGFSREIAEVLFVIQTCVWQAFGILFLSFLLFLVVRRSTLAKGLAYVTVTTAWILAAGSSSLLVALLCAMQVSLLMLALFRFGLLALTTTLVTAYLLSAFPVTWNTHSWVFNGSLFATVACAALAALGCYACVAGRPLLRSPLLVALDDQT